MANVIRAPFQGLDGRLNIDKGILTLYGHKQPMKWDITKKETTKLLREFLNTAYQKGKGPSQFIQYTTAKNKFYFGEGVRGAFLQRLDFTTNTISSLKPNTGFTKSILSAMVRANVK